MYDYLFVEGALFGQGLQGCLYEVGGYVIILDLDFF